MKLKSFVLSSLFLAIGFLLHQITPPFLFGMKPDFLLIMMFISIFLVDDHKLTTIVGIVSGILTAATTTFPGGQIPNLIDKIITCQVVYMLFKILKNRVNNNITIILVSFIGTFISGLVFLYSALIIVGLPVSFMTLLVAVVLPATLLNSVVSFFLFRLVNNALRYSMGN
ncbi:putative tryptophan transport protein [Clostridium liquoris]|jgi:hypothetical protein|uniref:Putative tryptophan transport protein n=1 Tax=Clostridium liquoris TaxID=1289519 RepID=A0A2T0B5N1_9CLOT|nr:tryptophan transporter [Clostridium liquoris]PRR79186.1 putative tryptophan transport protein [Clostridium liquoris]